MSETQTQPLAQNIPADAVLEGIVKEVKEKTAIRVLGFLTRAHLHRSVSSTVFFAETGVAVKRLMGHPLSTVITVSPYWYIRGGPHAAVSGVGDPRERQSFSQGFPLGVARRSGHTSPLQLGEVFVP
jgi:hypothetical protein